MPTACTLFSSLSILSSIKTLSNRFLFPGNGPEVSQLSKHCSEDLVKSLLLKLNTMDFVHWLTKQQRENENCTNL